MRQILLITEDPRALNSIQSAIVREGYRAAIGSPEEDSLLQAVADLTPEILIVDCSRGWQVVSDTRRLLGTACNLKELLVVALLTRDQTADVDWTGIDDFVLEPYCVSELLSRLRLLIRRARNVSSDQAIEIGDLVIDLLNHRVLVDGTYIELTFKEYELLRFLATHRGRAFTREALLSHVWGYEYYGGLRTVDVHIRRIRAKLSPACDGLIETVRNVGYRLAA